MSKINYKQIYTDLIQKKYPEKLNECKTILNKEYLMVLDILKLNQILFKNKDKETLSFNQAHRAYDIETILNILDYQKKNNLNNAQLSADFKLSTNTIIKWRRIENMIRKELIR